ncbi:hypothetical protein QBC41DRAFT_49844 [Cercophora samala]|uniref:Secreted protein n=1 Tax=Cercophora samala TaxID=330535 RepID=A0AA39ZIV4_9PEZI|nr:hypothetical protein QBC41DRAFT_49844 [Cercophora samala]
MVLIGVFLASLLVTGCHSWWVRRRRVGTGHSSRNTVPRVRPMWGSPASWGTLTPSLCLSRLPNLSPEGWIGGCTPDGDKFADVGKCNLRHRTLINFN